MTTISIIIITTACFFAAVLNLATENRFRNRVMSAFLTMATVVGLLLYGYGFAHKFGLSLLAVLRTLMAVCRMFAGVNDLGSIEAAPLFAHHWVVVIFWMAHFMAFYAMASATIAAIGGRVLRRIRVTLLRRGTLLVIYGVNANAVEYGKNQINKLHRSVVFIGQGDASIEAAINAAGGVLEKNGEQPDSVLLRRLGIRTGKRHIEVAALHEDGIKNFVFVQELMNAFEKARILPEQTMLLLRDAEADRAASMIASEGRYGYGSVMAFDEYELAARLMMQKLPPCEMIHFDENARAQEDFGALIIGFGRMGRAVLDALLLNGQFCGSKFRADIFDENAQSGILHDHEILRQYDIRFHQAGGKSDAFYAFLNEHKDAIRYIVLCTGDVKENDEIARDLGLWLKARGAAPAVIQANVQGLVFARPGEADYVYQNIYGSDALNLERIDRMAMAINHAYCRDSGKTPQENWKNCGYFSRMSSRASADFYPAVLRAVGKTVQQVEAGDWPPHDAALENLAITEHMRWCAFYYVMGFHLMDEAEYAQRIDQYSADMREKGKSSLRIGKDMEKHRHACLVPWEALDRLSDRENEVTGGHIDYKQMDRNNILVLPDVLAVLREISA